MEFLSGVVEQILNIGVVYATEVILSFLIVVIAAVGMSVIDKWEWINVLRSEESVEKWAKRAIEKVIADNYPSETIEDIADDKHFELIDKTISQLKELAPEAIERGELEEKHIKPMIERLIKELRSE